MNKNIQKQLKADFEKFEIMPSSDFWCQIEKSLDSSVIEPVKKPFLCWKYAAVIVFLLSLSSLFYLNFHQSSSPSKNVISVSEKKIVRPNQYISAPNSVGLSQKKIVVLGVKKDKALKNSVPNEELNEVPKVHQNDFNVNQKEAEIEKILPVYAQRSEVSPLKTEVLEHEKTSYISANELLLGREFDKTREEARTNKQFGVLDASKLKLKRPHSLNVFGITVFSDSVSVK